MAERRPAPVGRMHFRLVPGVECVPLDGDALLLVSDWARLKLEGRVAQGFAQAVLPALQQWTSLRDLVPMLPDLPAEDWLAQLGAMQRAGVLQRADEPPPPEAPARPGEDIIAALGQDGGAGAARLASLRVVVFGVESVGAHLASLLAPLGLARLALVDPFPLGAAEARGWPLAGAAPGVARATALADALRAQGEVVAAGGERLDKETVDALARDADLLVGCFDRGFSAAHHWINRAALAHGVPAVFAQASGTEAVVGPWVFAGESACYMCWRMRALAAADSFDQAMACERHDDGRRRPAGESRPTLPGLAAAAAGLLCSEIFTTLFALAIPSVANAVLHLDGLTRATARHAFLQRADCPSCRGVHRAVRTGQPAA